MKKMILTIIIITIMLAGCQSPTANTVFNGNPVKLDFYVMSQCPYGTQVETAIAPVLEQLGNAVDFNLNFIANDNGDGTFASMHGQAEVDGDILHLCAAEHFPDKYMKFIVCQNKNTKDLKISIESCAMESGIDASILKTCANGEQGKQLLSESIKKSQAVNARGSPTIYLNDQPYSGGRQSNDFLRAICNAFESEKPAVCSSIPESAEVRMVVLNDKRCDNCDVRGLIGQLKAIFPGLTYEEVDYSDAAGKKLFETTGLTFLPAILFDESVKKGEGYANIQRFLEPAGKYLSLKIGAVFDPGKEICDNGVDDTGNGKIDCDDLDCRDTIACRTEMKNKLDIFVMSMCPYGTTALNSMKEVLANFGDNIDFNIHYIANENADGTFQSLHGQPEVDENIRELCAIKYYPEDYKYMDYIWCRNQDIKGDWKTCTTSVIKEEVIQKCFEEEGKQLLSENIKITNGLGISASPTWMVNNRYKFSGIDADTIKTNFCKYNEYLEGCGNTLSSSTGAVSSGGGCGG